jgi:subtilisin family serine protease
MCNNKDNYYSNKMPRMNKVTNIIENKDTFEKPYQLIQGNQTKGKLSSNQNEVWYVFIPEMTGSYEVICKGNDCLSGGIYNESKTNHVNSSFVTNAKYVRLASTLIVNKIYYIKFNLPEATKKKVAYSLIIDKIKEPKANYFKHQWGLLNKINGLDINILPVWKYTMGGTVKICIADTGTCYKHRDLRSSINLELSYNFVHNLPEIFPENESYTKSAAKIGHGTHVAGIIGASLNNEKGIVGIAPDSDLISLKVLGSEIENHPIYNEASNSFIKAIEYAKHHGIKIMNCSFSGNIPSEAEKDAMLKAKDILFVIAAGNNSVDLSKEPKYPACYYLENSIVVAAINNQGELYETSNYGGPTDIAAPGSRIISTYLENEYIYADATSVAAPFVSAVCSLVLSQNDSLTPMDIKRRVVGKNNVTQLESLYKKVLSGGSLNAYKAVICPDIEVIDMP